MPETLLKKRKSQEKERADKAQDREAKKKVCLQVSLAVLYSDDTTTSFRLAPSNVVVLSTIFRD